MSLFNKLKSIFQGQGPRINSREEVKKQVNTNSNQKEYPPITYNYKTAKEKAIEPIPLEEREWILRFHNRECPYCHHIFEQIKGNRKCPECKNKVIVRSHFQTKEKCLLTEEEAFIFDRTKDYYYDIRWCVRECATHLEVSEDQFMKEWDKRGKAYSSFDIMWHFINAKRMEYAQKNQWGLYRNTFVLQAQNLDRRGQEEESYKTYLYLAFIDANGPSNIGVKPFVPDKYADQAPHTLSMIRFFSEKYNKTVEDVKKDFYEVTEVENNNALYPLKCEGAWKSVLRDYEKYLEEYERLTNAEKNNG